MFYVIYFIIIHICFMLVTHKFYTIPACQYSYIMMTGISMLYIIFHCYLNTLLPVISLNNIFELIRYKKKLIPLTTCWCIRFFIQFHIVYQNIIQLTSKWYIKLYVTYFIMVYKHNVNYINIA